MMKFSIFRILCAAIGFMCIRIFGAASSSVFDSKNECKHLRAQSALKIFIRREPYIVKGLGQLKLVDQIDLLKKDPITQCTFKDHIEKDCERGVPTLFALLQFGLENGFATKDYAIAGSLYSYFAARRKNEGALVHPFYNGELYDNIEYHLLEISEGRFKTGFMGTDTQVHSEDSNVWALRKLLNLQTLTCLDLIEIGYEYSLMDDFDNAIEWLQRGLVACARDKDFRDYKGSRYVDLLCDLASFYERKGSVGKSM